MTHDDRRDADELVVLDVQVGPADARGVDLDDHLAGARGGRGTLPRPTFSAPFAFFMRPVIWTLLAVVSVMPRL